MVMLLADTGLAQSQSSMTHTFTANGAAQPTGADFAPPDNADAGITVEITKIEEKLTDGSWHDVTNSWNRSNNPSAKVTCTKPPETSITNKTFRFTWKTNKTITGNPTLTQNF
ncbi:MAG: hypothetical protein KF830_15095 [Planctomycetes bacterium]|nr:hypothetical protein [Planctomycetota bacterium]